MDDNRWASNKVSRRQFGRLAAVSSLSLATGVIQPQDKEEERQKAAAERRRRAFEAIAKFDVPMATEPGFVFRP
jgi:hypothetical protein